MSEIEILHIINTPVDWVKLPLDKEVLNLKSIQKSEVPSQSYQLWEAIFQIRA